MYIAILKIKVFKVESFIVLTPLSLLISHKILLPIG